MISRLIARVTGRVQGVGYRAFVALEAAELGLTGYASNDDDGSVEILAEGGEPHLQLFLRSLHDGPALSQVEEVEFRIEEGEHSYERFVIR